MRNLDLLIPTGNEQPRERWTWATVTQRDPLRIRLDGESAPLDIDPENLVGALLPEERVWVQVSGRRVLIVGRAGGVGVPTGSVNMFMGSYAPTGWLLCDGNTFDGNLYPALADVLGGTTLPDFRRRFPLGWEWLVSPNVGQVDGSELITEAQMPSHFHDMSHEHSDGYASGGAHYHTLGYEGYQTTATGGTAWRVSDINNKTGGGGTNFTAATSTESHAHWVDIPVQYQNTAAKGGGQAYWPRFIVVNYIIKT